MSEWSNKKILQSHHGRGIWHAEQRNSQKLSYHCGRHTGKNSSLSSIRCMVFACSSVDKLWFFRVLFFYHLFVGKLGTILSLYFSYKEQFLQQIDALWGMPPLRFDWQYLTVTLWSSLLNLLFDLSKCSLFIWERLYFYLPVHVGLPYLCSCMYVKMEHNYTVIQFKKKWLSKNMY